MAAKTKTNSKTKVNVGNTPKKEESRTSLSGQITVSGSTGEVLKELLNPLEHILKKYNTHPVFSSLAVVIVFIVGLGQVTDSIDKTINFVKQHFASEKLEITLEQKALLIEETLKPTQFLQSLHSAKQSSHQSKKQAITQSPKIASKTQSKKDINSKSYGNDNKIKKNNSQFISEAPLSEIKHKIRTENIQSNKANSPSNRLERLQAIRRSIREEGS